MSTAGGDTGPGGDSGPGGDTGPGGETGPGGYTASRVAKWPQGWQNGLKGGKTASIGKLVYRSPHPLV
jgi:hypothetical protein